MLVGRQDLPKVSCQPAVATGLIVSAPFPVVLRDIKFLGVGPKVP